MYSEALAVLDHNTELYMIEEKQQEIESLQLKLQSVDREKQTLAEKLTKYESKYGKL